MRANINGLMMEYEQSADSGSPCLLLVHGFPLDRRMWSAQFQGLAGHARVIAPDLRGHGRSDIVPGPLNMERHADDLAGLLMSLEIERAIVVGLSMGGYVALAMWRRHPDRIAGLVLADTRAEPDTPEGKANRDRSIARVAEIGALRYADEMLARYLAPSNFADERVRQRMLNIMGEQPVDGIVGALEGLRDREDSRPTLPSIEVPTLVLVGAEDAITPPADAERMAAAIPGAEIVVIPNAGHMSPLENPVAFNAAVRRFLESLAPQKGHGEL